MSKKFEFGFSKDLHLEHPLPSKNYMPDWYKNTPRFSGPFNKPVLKADGVNKTVKLCVPFLDTMLAGYTVELWQDIEVTQTDGAPIINWQSTPQVAEVRVPTAIMTMPVPEGHGQNQYSWKSPYSFKTPKGYSCLITHPFNRFDLPFTTLSGIVDTDDVMGQGSIPFYLKDSFNGIIPKGTPIFQILPFKRDEWKSSYNEELNELGTKNSILSNRVLSGWYRDSTWKKKKYE